MSKKPRDNRPYIPPVRRIELSEGNTKLRWILIVVLLALGVTAIGVGVQEALDTKPGWNEINATPDQISCASEFRLMYDFSESGGNASALNKKLTEVYSQACEDAFLIFSPDVEGQGNVHTLNSRINETVTVDPVLYKAMELLNRYENRSVFLAPVNTEYDRVFLCTTDAEAALYDPQKNHETAEYVRQLMEYIADPEHIRIELLEGNRARLTVSDAYLAFAEENALETVFDFGWMKNAFVADYLADILREQGFVHGYLGSYDGFTRNLDDRGGDYSQSLFDRMENTIYLAAEFRYQGPMSLVYLRDFPMTELDQWHYYVYEDGRIASIMLNPQTGKPSASVASMISLSPNASCAEILMETSPSFLAETFPTDQAVSLKQIGISSVWCQNGIVYQNDASLALRLLDTGIQAGYQIQLAE